MEPQTKTQLKVLIVRHGETEDNKAKIIAGQRPGKLTPLGRDQAAKIGIYLAKEKRQFQHIYVSDLGRTRETFENAKKCYPYLGNVSTVFAPLLRERAGGVLEGHSLGEWEKNAKKEGKDIRVYKAQGAESWEDVNKRAAETLKMLVEKHLMIEGAQGETKILVVSHGGFIMQFINVVNRIQGKDQKFDNSAKNCSMHEFEISYPSNLKQYQAEKVSINYILKNFVGHL